MRKIINFCLVIILLLLTPIKVCKATDNNQEKCEALVNFCPECNYEEMIKLINRWQYPSSLKHYLERVKDIRIEIENILEENNVSKYYLYLALAESGGVLDNESPKKAKGLWQLMPYISRKYGIIVNSEIDERLDYKKATIIAAKYIKRNLEKFDNNALWAIAAYNAGGSNLIKKTNYKKGDSINKVKEKSYQSYALAIKVIKMIYVSECISETTTNNL